MAHRQDWIQIPQAPIYEINSNGIIRNSRTGKIIKWQIAPYGNKQTTLKPGNGSKKITVSLPSLMWLLHGKIIAKKKPIPVTVEKGTRTLRFNTLNDCAKFLANVTHLTHGGAYYHLTRRHTIIADWHIRYLF